MAHEINQDVAMGDRKWSYREEVGASVTEKIEDFDLRHAEGIGMWKADTQDLARCYVSEISIGRPVLRASNARDLASFFPGSFTYKKQTIYILGFGAFEFDPATHLVTFTAYFGADDVQDFEARQEVKHLGHIPEVRGHVIYTEPFLTLTPTNTPEWINE